MLLQAWIGLNVVDVVLTALSFAFGALEFNPYLGTIALTLGPERMLAIKLLFAVAIGGALWQRTAHGVLKILNWSLVVVVMYNALIITYALQWSA